jgi:hypothetical protein
VNECVKTGVVFAFKDDPETLRTGDLFYHAGSFSVRGVPSGTWTKESWQTRPMQLLLTPATLIQRHNSPYSDTEYGIQILEASKDFVEHVYKWYPNLAEWLP